MLLQQRGEVAICAAKVATLQSAPGDVVTLDDVARDREVQRECRAVDTSESEGLVDDRRRRGLRRTRRTAAASTMASHATGRSHHAGTLPRANRPSSRRGTSASTEMRSRSVTWLMTRPCRYKSASMRRSRSRVSSSVSLTRSWSSASRDSIAASSSPYPTRAWPTPTAPPDARASATRARRRQPGRSC